MQRRRKRQDGLADLDESGSPTERLLGWLGDIWRLQFIVRLLIALSVVLVVFVGSCYWIGRMTVFSPARKLDPDPAGTKALEEWAQERDRLCTAWDGAASEEEARKLEAQIGQMMRDVRVYRVEGIIKGTERERTGRHQSPLRAELGIGRLKLVTQYAPDGSDLYLQMYSRREWDCVIVTGTITGADTEPGLAYSPCSTVLDLQLVSLDRCR